MNHPRIILIVDMIVPDTGSASFSKLLDLNMLVMNGGRERTVAEFSAARRRRVQAHENCSNHGSSERR